MSGFFVSPEADEDIWSIWRYLATESGFGIADRNESELYDTFKKLARTPGAGHRRHDLTDHPVFFFAVCQYMVVYRKSLPVEIVAVIHGKRDVERILSRRLR